MRSKLVCLLGWDILLRLWFVIVRFSITTCHHRVVVLGETPIGNATLLNLVIWILTMMFGFSLLSCLFVGLMFCHIWLLINQICLLFAAVLHHSGNTFLSFLTIFSWAIIFTIILVLYISIARSWLVRVFDRLMLSWLVIVLFWLGGPLAGVDALLLCLIDLILLLVRFV